MPRPTRPQPHYNFYIYIKKYQLSYAYTVPVPYSIVKHVLMNIKIQGAYFLSSSPDPDLERIPVAQKGIPDIMLPLGIIKQLSYIYNEIKPGKINGIVLTFKPFRKFLICPSGNLTHPPHAS